MESLTSIHDYAAMADRMRPETSKDAIAERLVLLRIAVGGDSQVAFCAKTGISTNAWNNLERGRNRISLDTALELARSTGVSLDWIYRGADYEHTLPGGLADRLKQAREAFERQVGQLKRA
jgi:transcriptional regulator with XRE-family HTH domain